MLMHVDGFLSFHLEPLHQDQLTKGTDFLHATFHAKRCMSCNDPLIIFFSRTGNSSVHVLNDLYYWEVSKEIQVDWEVMGCCGLI